MNRASYLRQLQRLREQLNSIVEQAYVAADFGATEVTSPGTWSPAVDLFETADDYFLLAEVPGVSREELSLEVHGPRLVLSGRREAPVEGGNFHRMERHHGPFRRAFELDHELDPERVQAELEDGVLTVRVAKSAPAKHRIEVTDPEVGGG